MALQLNLTEDLQERLRYEAERCGEPAETVAVRVLDAHLPPRVDTQREAAVAMVKRWMEQDAALSAEDSQQANEFFRGLDATRTSNRPLFPPELEGISW